MSLLSDDDIEWYVDQLLFPDNAALVADSQGRLRQLVEKFGWVCKRRKLRVNESKSKVMKCARMVRDKRMNVALKGKLCGKTECCKYLVTCGG